MRFPFVRTFSRLTSLLKAASETLTTRGALLAPAGLARGGAEAGRAWLLWLLGGAGASSVTGPDEWSLSQCEQLLHLRLGGHFGATKPVQSHAANPVRPLHVPAAPCWAARAGTGAAAGRLLLATAGSAGCACAWGGCGVGWRGAHGVGGAQEGVRMRD